VGTPSPWWSRPVAARHPRCTKDDAALMELLRQRRFRPEPCIPYIEKALRLNPRETLGNVTLGKCQVLLGHVDEALSFFRKGQASNPGVWYVHLKVAGTLGLMGKLDGEGRSHGDG
jgi:hypothetical protein